MRLQVRTMAARCLAELARTSCPEAMQTTLQHLLPLFADMSNQVGRAGAVTTFGTMIRGLEMDLVPYAVLMLIPLMGAMSDPLRCAVTVRSHSISWLQTDNLKAHEFCNPGSQVSGCLVRSHRRSHVHSE